MKRTLLAIAILTTACNASELARNAEDEAKSARTQASKARAEAAAAKKEAIEAREAADEAKAEAKKALAKAEKALEKASEKPDPGACSKVAHVPKPWAPKIVFSSKGIEVNGKKLPEKPTVADLKAALGQAERVAKLANDIHVYEKLGVIAYQTPGTERIVQLTIFFARMSYAFMPAETYQGELTIDDKTIDEAHKATTLDLTPTLHVDVTTREDGCFAAVGIGFNAK